jgi:PleD family two-component response regulator
MGLVRAGHHSKRNNERVFARKKGLAMKKHILLVDDTQTVLMSEKLMLRSEDYDISIAVNGMDALEKMDDNRPDLILLDIKMPEMNGIEFCRRVKSNAKTSDIPIIMVTTKGEAEMVKAAFSAGCNDYITKPITKLQLLTKVRNLMH